MAHSLSRVTMTPEELEERRMKALRLFRKGASQAAAAKELGVTKVAAHYWFHSWKKKGKKGLEKRKVGPEAKLTLKDRDNIEAALLKGPAKEGYVTDLWTLKRIKALIKRVTGIAYGQTQVWRILHNSIGWSSQKPDRRARERDEKAIARWRKMEWPAIKKRGLA